MILSFILTTILLAAEATPETLPYLDFLNLGVLAFLAVAFIKGWVAPGYALDNERKENAELRVELTELRDRVDNQILPALWKTTDLLARYTSLMEDKQLSQD